MSVSRKSVLGGVVAVARFSYASAKFRRLPDPAEDAAKLRMALRSYDGPGSLSPDDPGYADVLRRCRERDKHRRGERPLPFVVSGPAESATWLARPGYWEVRGV